MEKEILWADCKEILLSICNNFSPYWKNAIEKVPQANTTLDFGDIMIFADAIILYFKAANNECWMLIIKKNHWEFHTPDYSYPTDIIDSVPEFPYKVLRLKSWLDEE